MRAGCTSCAAGCPRSTPVSPLASTFRRPAAKNLLGAQCPPACRPAYRQPAAMLAKRSNAHQPAASAQRQPAAMLVQHVRAVSMLASSSRQPAALASPALNARQLAGVGPPAACCHILPSAQCPSACWRQANGNLLPKRWGTLSSRQPAGVSLAACRHNSLSGQGPSARVRRDDTTCRQEFGKRSLPVSLLA